jgi:hypothetical protein
VIDEAFRAFEKHVPLSSQVSNREILNLQLKKIFVDNITETTVHGIIPVYRTQDNFIKVTVALCFLASAIFCCYMSGATFIEFFSFGVLTTTSVVSNVPAECKNNNYNN